MVVVTRELNISRVVMCTPSMVEDEEGAFLLYITKHKASVEPVSEWTGKLVALRGSVQLVGSECHVVVTVD